jgi:hypothetical protein
VIVGFEIVVPLERDGERSGVVAERDLAHVVGGVLFHVRACILVEVDLQPALREAREVDAGGSRIRDGEHVQRVAHLVGTVTGSDVPVDQVGRLRAGRLAVSPDQLIARLEGLVSVVITVVSVVMVIVGQEGFAVVPVQFRQREAASLGDRDRDVGGAVADIDRRRERGVRRGGGPATERDRRPFGAVDQHGHVRQRLWAHVEDAPGDDHLPGPRPVANRIGSRFVADAHPGCGRAIQPRQRDLGLSPRDCVLVECPSALLDRPPGVASALAKRLGAVVGSAGVFELLLGTPDLSRRVDLFLDACQGALGVLDGQCCRAVVGLDEQSRDAQGSVALTGTRERLHRAHRNRMVQKHPSVGDTGPAAVVLDGPVDPRRGQALVGSQGVAAVSPEALDDQRRRDCSGQRARSRHLRNGIDSSIRLVS